MIEHRTLHITELLNKALEPGTNQTDFPKLLLISSSSLPLRRTTYQCSELSYWH
ncbi:hypothetical protein SLEP1_g18722 [Rubroshorea leprosula]|uniref:Uncharacterized protein n=1 Tax=Rubroshorea leprosula TaxID=152421 RepID=A0AAV5J667_9ROSI|nr:hypothetical protein SLEP1_g18722 [Rubroshorea leprosula]